MAPKRGEPTSSAFKPGQSGNPGGQHKEIILLRRYIKDSLRTPDELVAMFFRIARGQEDGMQDGRVRFAALEWLSDRFYGRAPLVIEPSAEPSMQGLTLQDALAALDGTERAALKMALAGIERARAEGRLSLPAPAPPVPQESGGS